MASHVLETSTRPIGAPATGRVAWSAGRPLAGLLLFGLSAQFLTVLMLATGIAPAYDIRGGAISDLGAIAETATLFNVSLLAVGALNLVAGYLLFRAHGGPWLLATFAVAGAGAVGAAANPLGHSDLHGLFALAAFVGFNLEAIAAGGLTTGPMRLISVAAGVIGLAFVVLMVIGDAGNAAAFGPIGHGGTERMIVYPVMLWMLAFGGYLMAGREPSTD
jgi:hypothetical membrane protein